MPSRRAVLGTLGVATGSAFSGCLLLQSGNGSVELAIFNHTGTSYTVRINFFDDGASEAEARAYSFRLDVEPDGKVIREAVVESGRYLVRYSVYEEQSRRTDQDPVHFIPEGDDTEYLTFNLREPGELTTRR